MPKLILYVTILKIRSRSGIKCSYSRFVSVTLLRSGEKMWDNKDTLMHCLPCRLFLLPPLGSGSCGPPVSSHWEPHCLGAHRTDGTGWKRETFAFEMHFRYNNYCEHLYTLSHIKTDSMLYLITDLSLCNGHSVWKAIIIKICIHRYRLTGNSTSIYYNVMCCWFSLL